MNTATVLVERSIHIHIKILLAKLEDGHNLE